MVRVGFNDTFRALIQRDQTRLDTALRNLAQPARAPAPGLGLADANAAFVARRGFTGGTPTPPALRVQQIPLSHGATVAPDRATLDHLARRDDVPGAAGVREVKFLLTDLGTPDQALHLMNTNTFSYHHQFYQGALGGTASLERFNAETYFTDDRKNVAGTMILHDNYQDQNGDKGVFAVEFWPTDPVGAQHVDAVMKALAEAVPFAPEKLAYHPAGNTQEALFEREKAELEARGVRSISTADLFANVTYQSMNPGVGYGRLRLFDGTQDNTPPTVRDVVLFKDTPNDLTHVAGIITENPQTPLSHINLKAKQNNTPNAFLKNASEDPEILALVGKNVRFEVTPDGVQIREATEAEVEANLEKLRPTAPQFPPRDLSVTRPMPLAQVGFEDREAFGAKAANCAELAKILPSGMVPDGFAVPFSFYDTFMKETGLYDRARAMIAEPRFESDAAYREEQLSRFRRALRDADIPPALAAPLREMHRSFPPGTELRCRSSTNNEDLEGFNGAGLYDSYTHRVDEGEIDRTLKQVWSSLWNYRAFEERDFYRIDHFEAGMGVLVHPNFDDEEANGVALTRNIYDPNWPGFYVNVQVGEQLVTNPPPGATPDEFLISAIGPNNEYETQFIRRSSLTTDGAPILSDAHTNRLRRAMETIQRHFKSRYGRDGDPKFSMDLEFKVDVNGALVIKQARPEVHPKAPASIEPLLAIAGDALGYREIRHFEFVAPEAGAYVATLTPSGGDADLFLRSGAPATPTQHDARAIKGGEAIDTIGFDAPAGGRFDLAVYGWGADGFALDVKKA